MVCIYCKIDKCDGRCRVQYKNKAKYYQVISSDKTASSCSSTDTNSSYDTYVLKCNKPLKKSKSCTSCNKVTPAIQNCCIDKKVEPCKDVYDKIVYDSKNKTLLYYNGCEWLEVQTSIIAGCCDPNYINIPCNECVSDFIYIDMSTYTLYVCNGVAWVPVRNEMPLINRPQIIYSTTPVNLNAGTFLRTFPYFRTGNGQIDVTIPSAADLIAEMPYIKPYDIITVNMGIDMGGHPVDITAGEGVLFNGSTIIYSGDNIRIFTVQFVDITKGNESVIIY